MLSDSSIAGVTNRDPELLICEVTVIVPLNSPGVVSVRVNDFAGITTLTRPEVTSTPSLSEAACTCTVPWRARFGSFTVTARASSHW